MDYNGCEVIAAYNSMLTLGEKRDIRDIAYHFENDGQMLGGEFGTNPYAIKRYFTENGYEIFNYGDTTDNSSDEIDSVDEKMKIENTVPLVLHCIYKGEK